MSHVKASQNLHCSFKMNSSRACTHCHLKIVIMPSFLFRYSLSICTKKSEIHWAGDVMPSPFKPMSKKMEKKPRGVYLLIPLPKELNTMATMCITHHMQTFASILHTATQSQILCFGLLLSLATDKA